MSGSQAWPELAPEQQRLLLAALKSNRKGSSIPTQSGSAPPTGSAAPSSNALGVGSSVDPSLLESSSNPAVNGFPAYGNYSDQDFSAALGFDQHDADLSALDGSIDPYGQDANDSPSDDGGETGEKRKSPGDGDEQGDSKRFENGDEKSAKKPGRKPLTSEPTTKRKAQNRAAQRAFRERKEKHLKDLEQKVIDLEKASESANHENGLLRVQVQRLQDELSDYRKRMSMGSSTSSPPQANPSFGSSAPASQLFDFDFPKFGNLPGALWPGGKSGSGQSPSETVTNGTRNSLSPLNSGPSPESTSPENVPTNPTGGIFSPGFLEVLNNNFPTSGASKSGFGQYAPSSPWHDLNSEFQTRPSPQYAQHRSTSQSNTSAPSPGSSLGIKGASSSVCTSPESLIDSPNQQKDKQQDKGVYRNGFIESTQQKQGHQANDQAQLGNGFDWLASQSTGQFDPVLFGDYRESQDAIVGGGDFTNGFFEDMLNFPDFADPLDPSTSTQSAQRQQSQQQASAQQTKPSLMHHVDACREGQEPPSASTNEILAKFGRMSDSDKNMMTAHKIWKQIQDCPKFSSGDFDIDQLCSDLSTKAKCSETGLVIPKEHVEAALWRLAGVNGPPVDGQQRASH